MIGFYDYTVILTYLSILSGTTGIILCLNGIGHPFLGMFFLLFSGLCDTFDGKVARSKKNRTEQMKKFGIQIDSLRLACFLHVLELHCCAVDCAPHFLPDLPVISLKKIQC